MPVGLFSSSAEEVGQTASRSNPSCAYQDSFSGNVGQQWRRHQSPVCGNCSHEGTTRENSLPFRFQFMLLEIVNIEPRSQSLSSFLPLKRGTRQTLRTRLINILLFNLN